MVEYLVEHLFTSVIYVIIVTSVKSQDAIQESRVPLVGKT
jgi:hypothetical protein